MENFVRLTGVGSPESRRIMQRKVEKNSAFLKESRILKKILRPPEHGLPELPMKPL